jgi:hypothetical protein
LVITNERKKKEKHYKRKKKRTLIYKDTMKDLTLYIKKERIKKERKER